MAHGRIRAMFDFQGNPIPSAGPSTPVSVLGLSDVPNAGEMFSVVESDREARSMAAGKADALARQSQTRSRAMTLDQVFEAFQAGETQELCLIVKADVQGSLEPIVTSLQSLSAGEIKVNVLHAATGNIGKDDIMLASASKAIIVGFNVDADQAARRVAESEGVDIRLYDIIYRVTEDIDKALKGMLEPETRQVLVGRADVRAVFRIPKLGNIAGCLVTEGEVHRNGQARVLRAGAEVTRGVVSSLKHEKEDVRTMRAGFECGIGIKGFSEFAVGDVIECFAEEKAPAA
jgi:translation initiation factor IF-2